MIFDFDSLLEYIFIIFFSFIIFAYFYRKYYSSIYDPLFFNIVINLSFSTSLMYVTNSDKTFFIIEFILFQIAFFLGFITINKINLVKSTMNTHYNTYSLSQNSLNMLASITIIIFIIVILINLIIAMKTGFAIFSDNPTSAKVDNFSDGGGIYRRILWSIGSLSIIGSIILILSGYKKKLFIFVISISLIMSIGSGSKSALLPFVFFIYILVTHPMFQNNILAKKIKRLLPILMIFAIVVALLVLTIESDTLESAIYAFINRLLFNGDSVLYYYSPIVYEYFENYNFFTYLYNIFNGLLGMLRIVPYELPTGFQMIYEYNGGSLPFSTILGPNTPFYIVADMYFGPIIGFFYSFFVGGFIAYARQLFLRNRRNAINFLLSTWLYMASFTFIIEAPLFVGRLFEMLLFFTPIFLIVYLLHFNSRKKNVSKL